MRQLPFAAVAVTAAALVTTAVAAQTKLTFATALPTQHVGYTSGLKPYFDTVNRELAGKYVWEIVPGGTMGSWAESVANIRKRVVEGATVVDVAVPRDLPLSAMVSDLGVLPGDARASAAAINETVHIGSPELLEDFRKNNIQPIGAYSTSPFYLMCRERYDTLAELKGKRVRGDTAYGVLATAMGAQAVNVASPEIYEALQRKQIDCAIGAAAWLKSFSLQDVVRYVHDAPLGLYISGWLITANRDVFAKFTPEQRAQHIKHVPTMIRSSVKAYLEEHHAAVEAGKAKGMIVLKPDPTFLAKLAEHRKGEVQRVIEAAKGRGIANAEPIVNAYVSRLHKWEKIMAEIGDDWDKYESALRREIFDKVKL